MTVNEGSVLSIKKYKIYLKTVTDKMTVGRLFMEKMSNVTKSRTKWQEAFGDDIIIIK